MMSNSLRVLGALGVFSLVGFAAAQTLTLDDALRLAKERNGTIRAAVYNTDSARSRVRESFGAFLPTITPTFSYVDSRQDQGTGNPSVFSSRQSRTELDASWRLLDSGQRLFAYNGSRKSLEAQQYNSLQTLRQTLFTVHQQYYDALRAQELLRVADSQVARAQKVLDQTKAQVEAKLAPRKDILQAEADLANAKVQRLTAKNRETTTFATLRATIGWDAGQAFPTLVAAKEPATMGVQGDLESLIKESLARRADLLALNRQIDAQRATLYTAERQASINWALDAAFTQGWASNRYQNRSLSFNVSLPLFDGNISRENVRQANLAIDASKTNLVQAEREARSEVESEYLNLTANAERVAAAKAAVEAARLNYQAAEESFRLGAEGTSIVVVLTAQVSLVTAESNYIESIYDYLISDVRLRLVTGQSVPGE